MTSRSYDGMKQEMMERWFRIDEVQKGFFTLKLDFALSGFYYNRNVFANEPFIETFPLRLTISQASPMSNTR